MLLNMRWYTSTVLAVLSFTIVVGCSDAVCRPEAVRRPQGTEECSYTTSHRELAAALRSTGGIVIVGGVAGTEFTPGEPVVKAPLKAGGPYLAEEVVQGEVVVSDDLGEGVGPVVAVRAWTGLEYWSEASGRALCESPSAEDQRVGDHRCFERQAGLPMEGETVLLFLHSDLDGRAYFLEWFAYLLGTSVQLDRRPSEGVLSVEELRLP